MEFHLSLLWDVFIVVIQLQTYSFDLDVTSEKFHPYGKSYCCFTPKIRVAVVWLLLTDVSLESTILHHPVALCKADLF
jgi:hypothetical protein